MVVSPILRVEELSCLSYFLHMLNWEPMFVPTEPVPLPIIHETPVKAVIRMIMDLLLDVWQVFVRMVDLLVETVLISLEARVLELSRDFSGRRDLVVRGTVLVVLGIRVVLAVGSHESLRAEGADE
jgi:hypothetical protein